MTSSTTRSNAAVLAAEQPLERGLAGVDDFGLVAFGLEIEPQALGEVQLVFDDEDALRALRLRSPSAAAA